MTKKTNKDVIFECRKCQHNLYVTRLTPWWIDKLVDRDCPRCGEEGYRLWTFVGFGKIEDFEGEIIG